MLPCFRTRASVCRYLVPRWFGLFLFTINRRHPRLFSPWGRLTERWALMWVLEAMREWQHNGWAAGFCTQTSLSWVTSSLCNQLLKEQRWCIRPRHLRGSSSAPPAHSRSIVCAAGLNLKTTPRVRIRGGGRYAGLSLFTDFPST